MLTARLNWFKINNIEDCLRIPEDVGQPSCSCQQLVFLLQGPKSDFIENSEDFYEAEVQYLVAYFMVAVWILRVAPGIFSFLRMLQLWHQFLVILLRGSKSDSLRLI